MQNRRIAQYQCIPLSLRLSEWAGCGLPVIFKETHDGVLRIVSLADIKAHAIELS